MGAPQFAQQVDNTQTNNAVLTEAEITANTANQFDDDRVSKDLSSGDYTTGENNISGASEISGVVTINDSNSADIKVEWTDGTGAVLATESPSDLQGISDQATFNFIVKSTHFNLKVSGTSTDADITVNAH